MHFERDTLRDRRPEENNIFNGPTRAAKGEQYKPERTNQDRTPFICPL
jgi:hypothetical protein